MLTVLNQTAKANVRAKFAGKPQNKMPKALREKKTRAIRRRLTLENTTVLATGQKGSIVKKRVARQTVKAAKKSANALKIRYAVKAE